jgi:hypothetical protein
MSKHPLIRVSAWAAEEIRRRAAEERRTVVSVVDMAFGRPAVGAKAVVVYDEVAPAPTDEQVAMLLERAATQKPAPVVHTSPRCPKCGCSAVSHEKGASKNRCENHPPCVWVRP